MVKGNILMVDDEKNIVDVVQAYLQEYGYNVYTAFNGEQAFKQFENTSPSLVILDLMLPDIPGEEICTMIRKKSAVPIIMLTAKVKDEDVVNGLAIGADDFVTKPFSPQQLVARVSALLRRSSDKPVPLADLISFNNNNLTIDTLKYEVKKNGRSVKLTPSEYKLLMAMVRYSTRAFTREELIDIISEEKFNGFDRIIDSHIKNLRHKIEADPKSPEYILTVHGVGYRFGGESIKQ